jgi:quercetin dioxygenase-like cupin family protein
VQRPVAVLAYDYAAGDHVPAHDHPKAQLIYAVEGMMTVATHEGQWVLLPTRAV